MPRAKSKTIKRPKKSVPKKATPKKVAKKSPAKKSGGNKLPPKKKAGDEKLKRFDSKRYVRISSDEPAEKFKELGERVQKKELKWSYFTTENSIGMHYYLIL